VSYTDSMSEDYVRWVKSKLQKIYHTIYVDGLGAKFSNVLIIFCM